MEVQPSSSWLAEPVRPEQVNRLLIKLMEVTVHEFVETYNTPDKLSFVHALYKEEHRLKRREELWNWFLDDAKEAGNDGKFSFIQVCRYLGLDPDVFRQALKTIDSHLSGSTRDEGMAHKIEDRLIETIRDKEL